MAFADILVTNGIEIKKVPLGYSWTVLFFGPFPPLLRGDFLWAIGLFIGNILSYGIVGLVCSFLYNKAYARSLFDKGYHIHMLPPFITTDIVKNYVGYMTLPE